LPILEALILSCILLVNYLGIFKDEKGLKKSTGKFSFRDILAKMENKKECYQYLSLNNFPKMKIVLAKWARSMICTCPTLFTLALASG